MKRQKRHRPDGEEAGAGDVALSGFVGFGAGDSDLIGFSAGDSDLGLTVVFGDSDRGDACYDR